MTLLFLQWSSAQPSRYLSTLICQGQRQEIAPEFGTTCFFNCDQGYKRTEGSHSIVCNANKAWSGSPLQCEGQEDEHVTKQLRLDLHNA